jgi:hypothetical protein
MAATRRIPAQTKTNREVPVIRIAWYSIYTETARGMTAPPRLTKIVVSHTGEGELCKYSPVIEDSGGGIRIMSRRILYTGIFTKLPNNIRKTIASAEIHENPNRVNAAPITPRISSGTMRITRAIKRTIANIESGPAE